MEKGKIKDLLKRFHGDAKDESILIELLDGYYSLWRRFPYKLVKDQEEFRGLIIETLIYVWKNRLTFKSEEEILGTTTQYLKWRAISWSRKKRIEITDLDPLHEPVSIDNDISQLELITAYRELQKIYQAVNDLDDQIGKVMRLYFIKHMKFMEIASFMGISPESARTYKNRGVKILKQQFGYLIEDESNENIIRAMILLSELAFLIFF